MKFICETRNYSVGNISLKHFGHTIIKNKDFKLRYLRMHET